MRTCEGILMRYRTPFQEVPAGSCHARWWESNVMYYALWEQHAFIALAKQIVALSKKRLSYRVYSTLECCSQHRFSVPTLKLCAASKMHTIPIERNTFDSHQWSIKAISTLVSQSQTLPHVRVWLRKTISTPRLAYLACDKLATEALIDSSAPSLDPG